MAKSASVAVSATGPSSPVDPDQILKASQALLAHIKRSTGAQAANATKKPLFADSDTPHADIPILLTLTTKKHIRDSARLQPSKIAVPHSLNADPEATVCLITADPQRAYKDMVASEHFPDSLRRRVTRVVDLSHLKAKFRTFEAQRKLYAEHDVFLADDRIINQLPKALGKSFYKSTAKRPIPVVLMAARERIDGKRLPRPKGPKAKRDPAENVNARPINEIVLELDKALSAALVHLSPSTNTAVKVGYADWDAEMLAANVDVVAAALIDRFVPQKWNNVRSLYLKGPETAALPLWQTDELWVEDSQVTAKDLVDVTANSNPLTEKANIGKKRKSSDNKDQAQPQKHTTKKLKLSGRNDDALDRDISSRKARLRAQKKLAQTSAET